ncbi:hypothetical protein ACJX0J_036495 [Zea mays]
MGTEEFRLSIEKQVSKTRLTLDYDGNLSDWSKGNMLHDHFQGQPRVAVKKLSDMMQGEQEIYHMNLVRIWGLLKMDLTYIKNLNQKLQILDCYGCHAGIMLLRFSFYQSDFCVVAQNSEMDASKILKRA